MPKQKISALFRNHQGRVIGVIKGEIKNNVFAYKENGLLGFGGQAKTLDCDQSGILELQKKRNVIIYDNINGEWIQLIPELKGKRNDVESLASLMSDTRIAMLERDQMLEKPASLKALLEFLILILIIVAIIAIVYETNSATKNVENLYAPFNNQTKLQQSGYSLQLNNTKEMIKVCNLMESALTKNVTGYLSIANQGNQNG